MGLFSIVLFKQQQMPCHDNKAPSWKSGRKTKGFSWTLKVLNVCSLGRKKTGSLESGHLKIPGQLIWTFILERNSFCVRFVTQLQISKISIKTSKAWTLMFSLWGCLSDTWFEYWSRKETVLCQICNSASNLKHFYQDI